MKCLNCHKREAQKHDTYGILPCKECQAKPYKSARKLPEFTSEQIKQERKEYAEDIEQPFRKGEPNKRYIEIYGKERARQIGMSESEIEHAKYVYSPDEDYYDRNL